MHTIFKYVYKIGLKQCIVSRVDTLDTIHRAVYNYCEGHSGGEW